MAADSIKSALQLGIAISEPFFQSWIRITSRYTNL